ncbi:hypothetical protein MtrunA17_Chr7g0232691 [Medicago truncatula]|uniref:Uncharacterized protein n=1 Tax=Medicago truncatula TaxID=3880 RepID=A0A396H359_MEDTR|nr:hypothetical protein MtrunA17_Chr7g0232691 [Medicago truncatula]
MILLNKHPFSPTQHFRKKILNKSLIIQCHCISLKFLDLCTINDVWPTKSKERE